MDNPPPTNCPRKWLWKNRRHRTRLKTKDPWKARRKLGFRVSRCAFVNVTVFSSFRMAHRLGCAHRLAHGLVDTASLLDIGVGSPQFMRGLSMNAPMTTRPRRLTRTERSLTSHATSSFNAMLVRTSISPTTKTSYSWRRTHSSDFGDAAYSPIFACAAHRITPAMRTPNRAAAYHADKPPAEALKTCNRNLSLDALAFDLLHKCRF